MVASGEGVENARSQKQIRNSHATKELILNAAIDEFCAEGFSGANTTRIVQAAGCNIRMLYHYFDNKDGLYRAALTRVYEELRNSEQQTNFWDLPPKEGLVALTHFTFDYMISNQRFPKMILNENLNMGRVAAQIQEAIFSSASPFLEKLELLVARGYSSRDFSHHPPALQLYLTILALSFIHISNAHTLQATFDVDLASPDFLATRKSHVTDVVLSYMLSRST